MIYSLLPLSPLESLNIFRLSLSETCSRMFKHCCQNSCFRYFYIRHSLSSSHIIIQISRNRSKLYASYPLFLDFVNVQMILNIIIPILNLQDKWAGPASRGESVEVYWDVTLLTLDVMLRSALSYHTDCQTKGYAMLLS